MSLRKFIVHTGQRRAVPWWPDDHEPAPFLRGPGAAGAGRRPSPASSVPWPVDPSRQDLNEARAWLYGDLPRRYPPAEDLPDCLDPGYAALLDLLDRTRDAARAIDRELRRAETLIPNRRHRANPDPVV